jgi:hypothetical protein
VAEEVAVVLVPAVIKMTLLVLEVEVLEVDMSYSVAIRSQIL